MTDYLQEQIDRLQKQMAGLGPVQKQIILMRLADLYDNPPPNAEPPFHGASEQRKWLSKIGVLIKAYDSIHYGISFDTKLKMLGSSIYGPNLDDFVAIVSDVIEAIKLELELDGRTEIGTVYKPGEVYRFYADLKEAIGGAGKEIFLIEPYLTGQAFDEYFGAVRGIQLRLLVSKQAAEIKSYADRHSQQYQTIIEVRKSKEIHDRLIIADQGDVWVIGGSLNMKGDKPTYLLPLTPGVAKVTRDLYTEGWDRSNPVS
jgi:hypothetical protein